MSDGFENDNLIVLPGFAAPPSADEESAEAPNPQGPPSDEILDVVLESLLLAADRPLSTDELDAVMCGPGADVVGAALRGIQDRLRGTGGLRLVQVAKGWQLRTDPRAAPWVAALRGGRPLRLSRAALETLTVVAYRQPVTRGEVEELRGVDVGGVMRMLAEHELVQVVGRKEDPGRPLLYGTTPRFLEVFGLRDLSDLPTLRDLRELVQDDPRLGQLGEGGGWGLEPELVADELSAANTPHQDAPPDDGAPAGGSGRVGPVTGPTLLRPLDPS